MREPFDVADDNLAADHHKPRILPGAQDTADRVQLCRDFGNLLARYVKVIDEDAFLDLAPRLAHEPEHGVGHTMLHVLSRHLLESGMSLPRWPYPRRA